MKKLLEKLNKEEKKEKVEKPADPNREELGVIQN
jgi:hypothetical protein